MSAAEEDTELRDLLIHTLENNGVLNKIKAELRASVFLALEEQERAENKPSLINESLRQLLATRDGRLLSGLLTDFLQHFHLDFTLAVLQPEACLPSAPEDRTAITRELGLPEAGKKGPLLLQLLRCFRQRDSVRPPTQELPPEYTAEARAQFRLRSRAGSGEVGELELRAIMAELCPHFPGNMLERYITDELAGREPGIDEQSFLAMYRRLYLHCRSVVSREPPEDSTPREAPQPDESKLDEDDLEGDSFFDDPIPKPEKTYGWKEEVGRAHPGCSLSQSPPSGSPRVTDQDRELRSTSEKMGAGNDDDYMDDFQSSSQRSEKSEASIGEDLEGELSVEDLTASEPRLEELTLDNSLSHLSDVADYLEEVS
ncbi:centrosomal protein 43 [Hyla sarda]|uniref:centrosomal protein 43 n=1 Tax=Hyla sarda TaxID=327740 RepID=UPI0024C45A35|nr:centrosomal protein 43 [Hyla sarda]